jgi:hypothetical protein
MNATLEHIWQEFAGKLGQFIRSRVQRGRARLGEMLNQCCTFEFDRRGKVIECEPRSKSGCENC